jgi:hypothetical protein
MKKQQTFTSPGTWTCPPTVKSVELLLVGGGGGGSSPVPFGIGGGGGVRSRVTPVSAPVPVTVGAGGSAGSAGGTSAFGPLGPGPIPSIPPTTVAVGGGGTCAPASLPGSFQSNFSAPIIGGGNGSDFGNNRVGASGAYGYFGVYASARHSGSQLQNDEQVEYEGLGDSGITTGNTFRTFGGATPSTAAVSGTGGGGNSSFTTGAPGSVVVTWYE